jgi:hypothetical protein
MIATTWRYPEPRMTTSQKHAIAIKALIDTSKTPLNTEKICAKLGIKRYQFQGAKPYFRDYKSVGLQWFAPENIEAASIKYEAEKRLLAITRNAFHNKKRREAA